MNIYPDSLIKAYEATINLTEIHIRQGLWNGGLILGGGLAGFAVSYMTSEGLHKIFNIRDNSFASIAIKVSAFVLGSGVNFFLFSNTSLFFFTAEQIMLPSLASGAALTNAKLFRVNMLILLPGLLFPVGMVAGYVGNPILIATCFLGAALGAIES
jgi:hypothetical protein